MTITLRCKEWSN